jgi:REP element-mobilizing transposase RayT
VAFPDQSRSEIVQLLKGGAAYRLFELFPLLREELGGHLWQQSYQWVQVKTHAQLRATVAYVNENRSKIGLPPIDVRAAQNP